MLTRRSVAAGALALAAPGASLAQGANSVWPTGQDWPSLTPAEAGMDAGRINTAVTAMLADKSLSVLVLRRGAIVAEHYANPGPPPVREVASVGKSMLSVLVGMAMDQGAIKGVEQNAADFVPQWRGTPKAAIKIRHLLTMTSGLDFDSLQVRGITGDQFALNAAAPLRDAPGARWAYATPVYHLLFHVIERAVGERFEVYAQRMLLDPLGMTQTSWVSNSGTGSAGPVTNYYTARCNARDLARFGLFALQGGVWRGKRLVSAAYMHDALSPSQTLNPSYGYLWWENREPGVGPAGGGSPRYAYPGAPRDLFAALGAGGQIVAASPSLDLVIVRQGQSVEGDGAIKAFVRSICDAASPKTASL